MYKCDECNAIFETPKEYCTEEQIFAGCPDTQCKGTYTDVFKCSLCDEWKSHDEIHKNLCYDCAEKEYTDRLGLKFISEKHRDFFLEEYGILDPKNGVDKDLKSNLVEVLEKDFVSLIDMETDWNHKLEVVKEYIFDSRNDCTDKWVEFLQEEI